MCRIKYIPTKCRCIITPLDGGLSPRLITFLGVMLAVSVAASTLTAGMVDRSGATESFTNPSRIVAERQASLALDIEQRRSRELEAWIAFLGPEFGPEAYDLAERYGIPHDLARRLIHLESQGDPGATSDTCDHGLMQLNCNTWPWLAEAAGVGPNADPSDPSDNLRMGFWYLAYLRDKYGGDWEKTLSAYNLGERGFSRWIASRGTARTAYSSTIMDGHR